METVDKIYELINQDYSINVFKNNQDLFWDFILHYMNIHYFGYKVISIYNYLLEFKPKFDEYDFDYTDDIFHDINFYEQEVTQSVYNSNNEISDDNVDAIYAFIEMYNNFKKYDENNRLIAENKFVRDYTGSMIIILNKSFFKLSVDNIKKLMNSIENNAYLKELVEKGTSDKQLLDMDYIAQYSSRFLFNKEFTNRENIEKDILLNAIINGKIKDKELVKSILKKVNINIFYTVFDNDLTRYVDMIESIFNDELDQKELFDTLKQKILDNEDQRYLLHFIMNDKRNSKYLDEKERKEIINYIIKNFLIDISEEELMFLLQSESSDIIFNFNTLETLKNNNWSTETKEKIESLIPRKDKENFDKLNNISFNAYLKILDKGFKENNLNICILIFILKKIIKEYLNDESINVYVAYSKGMHGCAIFSANTIILNVYDIQSLVSCKDLENHPEFFDIFDTIFHESRHIVQSRKSQDENMSEELYLQYKERILRSYSQTYYDDNYEGISYEQDARLYGALCSCSFFNKYFSYMTNTIKYFYEKKEKELKNSQELKKVFELSDKVSVDEAIEKLIAVNPNTLIENVYLAREYNMDGTKKEINTQK